MDSDKISQQILENIGFYVEKLKEKNNRKEVDFKATFDEDIFLIEAKLKTDDEKQTKQKEQDLKDGKIHIHEDELGSYSTLSKVIYKATKQIKSSSTVHNYNFKLVFVLCYGINPKTKIDKALDSIYGRTQILEINQNQLKTCYFYKNSDFYKYKEYIDGAIIGYMDYNQAIYCNFCLNPLSINYPSLKKSSLAKHLTLSIIDPVEEEKNGKAYIPDNDIPRINDDKKFLTPFYNPMNQHLQRKYNTDLLMNIDFCAPEISIRTKH